jgi:hypothetical protein
MHEEESFLEKYILKGMNLAFLLYVLFKRDGEERKLRHQSLFIQKSTLDFLRDLGNNAMLSSTSIVVSNDQFH